MALFTLQKIQFSFIIDWFFIFLVAVATIPFNIITPFERQFRLDDDTISHPYKSETFSIPFLVIATIGFPALIITIYHIIKRDFKYGFHQAVMGFCVSIVLALFVTSIIKISVGRFRPDFLSRCQVDITKVESIYKTYNISNLIDYGPRNLYDTSICTNPNKSIINEGRKSFPSGHSSFAFASLTYTSLFIAGKIHLYDGNFIFWKLLAVLIPNLFALYVALTRMSDYRHHWQDIVVGSLIGIIFSVISYFYYFSFLNSSEPYKPLQGRLRKYNVFHDHSGKTLPVFRDKDSEVTNVE